MKIILLDFLNFINKPKDEQYTGTDKKYKWNVFFTLFLFAIVLVTIFMCLVYSINLFDYFKHVSENNNYSILKTILLMVFLIPFFEEITMRLPLRRNKFFKKIISNKIWNKLFPILFYFLTIFFGLIHITNYTVTNKLLYIISPIMVLPQLLLGFIIAYIRVRFNFWISSLFHFVWNFVAIFIIGCITFYVTKQPDINIKNDNYNLQIKEKMFADINSGVTISFNISKDSIYSLDFKNQNINQILKMINPEIKYQPINMNILDLDFDSKKGIPTETFINILEDKNYIEKE